MSALSSVGKVFSVVRRNQSYLQFFPLNVILGLEDLVQTKDAVLQHKQDLTKQYADAGEQLAEQCDEIQLATRHTHKKRRVCRA